jgi:phosphinothricin acetyltransferase
MAASAHLRDATVDDAVAINALYNATVTTTTVQWTEQLETVSSRRAWVERQLQERNPLIVAEVDHEVIGFASYDDFRDSVKWPGYRFTVEHTIHVDGNHQGSGVGGQLLLCLLERAPIGVSFKHVLSS